MNPFSHLSRRKNISGEGIASEFSNLLRLEVIDVDRVMNGDIHIATKEIDGRTLLGRYVRSEKHPFNAELSNVKDFRSIDFRLADGRLLIFHVVFTLHTSDMSQMCSYGMTVGETDGSIIGFYYDEENCSLYPLDGSRYDVFAVPDVVDLWESFGPELVGENALGGRDVELDRNIQTWLSERDG